MQSDSEHSSVDDRNGEEFTFSTLVGVKIRGGKEIPIRSSFIQEVDGMQFIFLDFRGSRGVCQLLTSRIDTHLKPKQKRKLFGPTVTALTNLRLQRDNAIKASVFGGLQPVKNTKLHAKFIGESDVVEVTCLAVFDGEAQIAAETTIACLSMKKRVNRNSQLWVKLESSALDYLRRVIAFQAKGAAAASEPAAVPPVVSTDAGTADAEAAPSQLLEVPLYTPQKRPRIFEALMKGAAK